MLGEFSLRSGAVLTDNFLFFSCIFISVSLSGKAVTSFFSEKIESGKMWFARVVFQECLFQITCFFPKRKVKCVSEYI